MRHNLLTEALLHRSAEIARLSFPERLKGKVVAVTGAGGSIGSELCRQLTVLAPRLLLLIGHGEHSLFQIAQDLSDRGRFSDFQIVLADVATADLIDAAFARYRPDVVIHAAAHKHVPIVEQNLTEGARTNVLGAYTVARCAVSHGARDVVLLSTDKAVQPANVMGLTKLAAENIWQSFPYKSDTRFITVRFGNVLGSRGSVLEIFERQIELGVPLSLTDRRMQRYFLTIEESASWILRAIERAAANELFIVDSGEPIAIAALAERLLAAHGISEYPIAEVGIRPGEKLNEQLMTGSERTAAVREERFFIVDRPSRDENLKPEIERLAEAIRSNDDANVLRSLHQLSGEQERSTMQAAL
jgi:FlaA1/EpsC-like NDP-sugar epimerase